MIERLKRQRSVDSAVLDLLADAMESQVYDDGSEDVGDVPEIAEAESNHRELTANAVLLREI